MLFRLEAFLANLAIKALYIWILVTNLYVVLDDYLYNLKITYFFN